MAKLLAALSLPQVGNIKITGEVEDSQGKGVVIQLELKDREYTLRALTMKEAQKWVDVLTSLRDGSAESNSTDGAAAAADSSSTSSGSKKASSKKNKGGDKLLLPAGTKVNTTTSKQSIEVRSASSSSDNSAGLGVKDMSEAKPKVCCGFV